MERKKGKRKRIDLICMGNKPMFPNWGQNRDEQDFKTHKTLS
jgi:hypothetical protein